MPVKSLMELAMSVIMKNIKELDDAGDFLPYETLRPILMQIQSGKQLRQIELNSPQIEGQTGEIWLKLIKKKFPMEYRAQLYKPPDPTKWYKVYEKYQKIHNDSLKESELKLKQALQGYKDERARNTSQMVDPKKVPISHRAGYIGTKRIGPKDYRTSSLNFTSGSKTKTLTGAGVMKKVRREVKEVANIHRSLSRISQAPNRFNTRQIERAPEAMINDYARAAKPSLRTAPPRPPTETPAVIKEHDSMATYISDDDNSDFAGDDDDLFDQKPAKSKGGFRMKARPAEPTPSRPKPIASSSGVSRPQPVPQKGQGLLSNRGRPPPTIKTRKMPVEGSRPSREVERVEPESSRRAEARVVSPTMDPPESPPAPTSGTPKINPLLRKRKPVDVFMRNKKRR